MKIFAFIKRDLLQAASYKFAFLSSFAGIFLSAATFYFISRLIPGTGSTHLDPYGGDYFSFVIVGIAFSGILGLFQEGLPDIIQQAQMEGTLEALLVTQTGIPAILFGSSVYTMIYSSISTVFHIIIAIVIFGMKLGNVNWLAVFLVFFLTSVCFLSIGILSASFILVYKRGNPFGWMFGGAFSLLGGVFFPISILPSWIRWASYLLPITHSLEGLRLSLLTSASFSEILPNILVLTAFASFLLPASLLGFRFAVIKAKKDGSLTHY